MAKRKKSRKSGKGSIAMREKMARLRAMKRTSRKAPKRRKASRKRASFENPRGITDIEFSLNELRNKGRKMARKAGVKPFFFTGRKRPQIVVSEGDSMKRRSRSKSRRSGRGRKHYGFEGKSRRRSRRSRRTGRFFGGIGGGSMKGVTNLLTQGAVGAAGAIGSAYIANALPLPENMKKFKPAVPLAVAVLLLMLGRKIPMSGPLAVGAAMSGVLGFVKQFAPSVPTLAGVETAPELSVEDQLLLGIPQSYGAVQEYQGESAMTPADL